MPDHKFRIGEVVYLSRAISRNVPGGVCEITKQLPESAGEYGYRIKSINEPHERVVRESELYQPHYFRPMTIAQLDDAFRQSFTGGQVLLSRPRAAAKAFVTAE